MSRTGQRPIAETTLPVCEPGSQVERLEQREVKRLETGLLSGRLGSSGAVSARGAV